MEFVFEIGTEEMPARFLADLEDNLAQLFASQLESLRISAQGLKAYSTPRRLVCWIDFLAPAQAQSRETIFGPPENVAYDSQGELTKAGQGFARSQQVQPEQIFVQETPKGRYLAVEKEVGGAQTRELLPGVCNQVLHSLSFQKKMHWEPSGFTFGRPIRWILALLEDELIPVQVASLKSQPRTWGHRVMGPGPWELSKASDYWDVIHNKAQVVLDSETRKEQIQEAGNRLAIEKQGRVVWKPDLLLEVSNLVEYPKPILGSFDLKYLELPREVLLTSMESHQKSFGLEDEKGNILPYFLCTLNLEPQDLELVRKGWERVLKARLEDAAFFWKVDSRAELFQWREKLDKVIFIGPLGSMGDKARRMQALCSYLSQGLAPELEQELVRSADLAKTDLVSEMVGEFDNLQGIMGSIYARQKGESETVARAIYEQYLPAGQDSPVPSTLAGALLSMADKADNLVGCFGLEMLPTGAHDPYALRRQALGIVRILLEKGLRLSLRQFLGRAQNCYQQVEWQIDPERSLQLLLDFFAQRIRAFYAGSYSTRIIDAALGAGLDDIYALDQRLHALDRFSRVQDFETAVLTFKRVDNILRKQGDKAGQSLDGEFAADFLQEPAEQELAAYLQDSASRWQELRQKEDYEQLLQELARIRPLVDRFFDQVMVMAEDKDLRLNRMNLLQALLYRLSPLADFSALQI
ncbi:MAG: glycine--tRNA ligase subunit beta [Desulfohalobiaceae bacterium]